MIMISVIFNHYKEQLRNHWEKPHIIDSLVFFPIDRPIYEGLDEEPMMEVHDNDEYDNLVHGKTAIVYLKLYQNEWIDHQE